MFSFQNYVIVKDLFFPSVTFISCKILMCCLCCERVCVREQKTFQFNFFHSVAMKKMVDKESSRSSNKHGDEKFVGNRFFLQKRAEIDFQNTH